MPNPTGDDRKQWRTDNRGQRGKMAGRRYRKIPDLPNVVVLGSKFVQWLIRVCTLWLKLSSKNSSVTFFFGEEGVRVEEVWADSIISRFLFSLSPPFFFFFFKIFWFCVDLCWWTRPHGFRISKGRDHQHMSTQNLENLNQDCKKGWRKDIFTDTDLLTF